MSVQYLELQLSLNILPPPSPLLHHPPQTLPSPSLSLPWLAPAYWLLEQQRQVTQFSMDA